MSELSRSNRFLIVQAAVVLTDVIDPVIASLDIYFEQANLKAIVTSGFYTPEHQLDIIRQYLTSKGLSGRYPAAMSCRLNDKNPDGTFTWQMAWSHLLNVGVLISPPIAAKMLMEGNHENNVVFGTSHSLGVAFNIGGGGNNMAEEMAIVKKAGNDKLPGLISFRLERENNAIHCHCR